MRARVSVVVLGVLLAACTSAGASGQRTEHAGKPAEADRVAASTTSGPIVWAAVQGAGDVVKVDVRAREVLRRFQPGGGPHNITVGPDGTVAAALYESDKIALIRRGRMKVVTLGARPHDVKIRGKLVVVANEDGRRLDLVSVGGKKLGRVPLQSEPHDIAIEPGGKRVWASLNEDDRLAVVNLSTRHVRYVHTGHRPHDLLFAPDGRLFVTDWTGKLLVLSQKGTVLSSRSLGQEAHHLDFTPDGRQVWITDHDLHKVFVLSTKTLNVLGRISVPGAPHHVTILPSGKRALVADHSNGVLRIYSVATRRQVGKISVGAGPHGVWAVGS